MTTASVQDLPGFSVKKILHVRDRLAEVLVPGYSHITLDAAGVAALADDLRRILPKTMPGTTLRATAAQLIDQCLTEVQIREFCWRIAGNQHRLVQGSPAVPWRSPGILEWAPVQVLRVDPAPQRNSEYRFDLQMRVLAGTACPLIFPKAFSSKWLGKVSRFAGFTDYRGHRPYLDAYQFAGLRFYALLDPALTKGQTPNFHELRFPASCMEHNVALLNKRSRQGSFVCPMNFMHACHQCPIGIRRCEAATHREDYVQKLCTGCGKVEWQDPEVSSTLCVHCHRRQAAAPQRRS